MLSRTAIVAFLALAPITAAMAAPATLAVNLPAQDLATSLNEVAHQAGAQISFPYDLVDGRQAPALQGSFTLEEAIRRLVGDGHLVVISHVGDVIMLGKPASVGAVDRPVSDDPHPGDLVVIGTKLTRERAIEQKAAAPVVQDVLGSDELGQLPEKNVGEALNHLPGVSMLVEKGEGRFIQIRGINPSLNNVTINGIPMGSPESDDGGREVPLDLVSGGILGGAQVIKTRTPDMDGQGIGGSVNIQTKMPFDRTDSLYGYAVGRYGYETARPYKKGYGGHDPYSFDGILSGKLADGRLGWLLGATYEAREYATQGVYNDDWTQYKGGNAPQQVKNNYYVIGRKRLNVDGALQFRPDGNSEYFIRGFYAKWNEFQHRNRYQYGLVNDVEPDGPNSGTAGLNAVSPNIRLERENKTVLSGAAGGRNDLGKLHIDYLAQVNRNTFHSPASSWEFESDDIFGPNHYSIDGKGVVTVKPDPSSPNDEDPSLMKFSRLQIQNQVLHETSVYGQFNARYELSDALSFKAGGRISQTKRSFDSSQAEYDPTGDVLTLATSPSFNKGGFTNRIPAGNVPNIWMNVQAMDDFFADPANAKYFKFNPGKTFNGEFGSDYGVTERIYAGYAMATGQLGPVQVVGGLRVEATHEDTSGYLLNGDQATLLKVHGHYIDWLPSFLVNYRPTRTLVLRGAITRAIGRPDFNTIAPTSSYTEDNNLGSISIGNPSLRARSSWNYDLSLEWYPNKFSAVTVALFDKQISHDLLPLNTRSTTQDAITAALAAHGLAGVVDPTNLTELNVSTTVNGGTSTLRGVEIAAQTQFSMLPAPFDGLGASVSATFIQGHSMLSGERIPLLEQPKHVYSITGFFQKGRWDASVSYVLNAAYLTDLDTENPANDIFQGKFGRIDAKFSYSVGRRLKIFLEGVNLNDEPTSEFQGHSVKQATEYEYVGRTIYAGFSLGFGRK